ncbi:hypothetical protein CsSME_00014420 [Camellia sinensis var. sinensis]
MNKFTILLSKCSSATVQSRREGIEETSLSFYQSTSSLGINYPALQLYFLDIEYGIPVLIMLLMLFKLLQWHEDNEAVEYRERDIIVQKRHGHSERIGKHASSTNDSQGCFSIKKMIRQNVMIVEKAYPRNGFTNGKSFKSWSVLIQSNHHFLTNVGKNLENMFGAMHRQQVFWTDVAATVFLGKPCIWEKIWKGKEKMCVKLGEIFLCSQAGRWLPYGVLGCPQF